MEHVTSTTYDVYYNEQLFFVTIMPAHTCAGIEGACYTIKRGNEFVLKPDGSYTLLCVTQYNSAASSPTQLDAVNAFALTVQTYLATIDPKRKDLVSC
jgi:hypothetical protein